VPQGSRRKVEAEYLDPGREGGLDHNQEGQQEVKFDIRTLPKLAVAGWGDKVFRGALVGYLKGLKIQRCLEYIHNNQDLLGFLRDEEWATLRKVAKASGIHDIENEFMTLLQKYRPDLMDIIINEPGGKEWLAGQVAKLKARLG